MDVTLRRVAGVPYPASYALAPFTKDIADVNGYYCDLGLVSPDGTPDPSVSQEGVKRAYRARTRVLHPDSGASDADAWERLQCAWECLSNGVWRYQYDQLRHPMKWLDRRVLARLPAGELAADIERRLRELIEPPLPPTFAWYYEEGAEPPGPDSVGEWLRLYAYVQYRLGGDSVVRLGFSKAECGVIERRWGRVLMVPPDAKPSTFFVAHHVRFGGPYRLDQDRC